MTWLIVALPYIESAADRSLAARAVVSRPTTNDLLSLRNGIEDGHIVGAAVVDDEPREDSLWRAFEWRGSVYVDRACEEPLTALTADGWQMSVVRDEYVILDPPVADVSDEEPRNHLVRVVERDE